MGKHPTGTRKNNNRPRVYGIIPNRPRKMKMKIHIPTPPRTPTAMNTNGNNNKNNAVNNAINRFSKMKVSKGRKKTITLQPTMKLTRKGRGKTGHREEERKRYIDELTQLTQKKKEERKKKRELKESVNNILSAQLSGFSMGNNSMGSKSTRKKSTGRKLKRRKSTIR